MSAALLDPLQVVEDIVDRSDLHGLFFFLAGEGKAQDAFDLAQQFNRVDAVESVVSQVVIQARFLEFEILDKDRQDFFLQYISFHDGLSM